MPTVNLGQGTTRIIAEAADGIIRDTPSVRISVGHPAVPVGAGDPVMNAAPQPKDEDFVIRIANEAAATVLISAIERLYPGTRNCYTACA